MNDIVTLTGVVATDPRHTITPAGLAITSFRLASTQRRFDRAKQAWVDAATNWYTVSTFRQLAVNTAACVKKSERVVVTGRLRIREWGEEPRKGMTVEVDADTVGHDLLWGTSAFTRSVSTLGLAQRSVDDAADGVPDTFDAASFDHGSGMEPEEPGPLAADAGTPF